MNNKCSFKCYDRIYCEFDYSTDKRKRKHRADNDSLFLWHQQRAQSSEWAVFSKKSFHYVMSEMV